MYTESIWTNGTSIHEPPVWDLCVRVSSCSQLYIEKGSSRCLWTLGSEKSDAWKHLEMCPNCKTWRDPSRTIKTHASFTSVYVQLSAGRSPQRVSLQITPFAYSHISCMWRGVFFWKTGNVFGVCMSGEKEGIDMIQNWIYRALVNLVAYSMHSPWLSVVSSKGPWK